MTDEIYDEKHRFVEKNDDGIQTSNGSYLGTTASLTATKEGILVGNVLRHVLVIAIGFLQFGKYSILKWR